MIQQCTAVETKDVDTINEEVKNGIDKKENNDRNNLSHLQCFSRLKKDMLKKAETKLNQIPRKCSKFQKQT